MTNFIKFFCIFALIFTTTHGSLQASIEDDLTSFTQVMANDVLVIIKSQASYNEKEKRLQALFVKLVDIDWMAKFAVAKFWRTMSPANQNEYLKVYKNYLLKLYVPRFRDYNDQDLAISGIKSLGNSQFLISTDIIASDGVTKVNIQYRCKDEGGRNFKIRDIVAENISLITTQRSEFSSIIEQGKIDDLITILRNKVVQ